MFVRGTRTVPADSLARPRVIAQGDGHPGAHQPRRRQHRYRCRCTRSTWPSSTARAWWHCTRGAWCTTDRPRLLPRRCCASSMAFRPTRFWRAPAHWQRPRSPRSAAGQRLEAAAAGAGRLIFPFTFPSPGVFHDQETVCGPGLGPGRFCEPYYLYMRQGGRIFLFSLCIFAHNYVIIMYKRKEVAICRR